MKTCPSCKKEVADNARSCPGCGHTFTTSSGVIVAVVIGAILGVLALAFCTRGL